MSVLEPTNVAVRNISTERVVIAVTLKALIREVLCLTLGRDTGYYNWGFHHFPQYFYLNAGSASWKYWATASSQIVYS
jgi:hypothetical protein